MIDKAPMTEKLLTEMNYNEMSALINDYIDRSAQHSGEMPASTFFPLLFANLAQRVKKTFEVEGRIVNGQLVFLTSDAPSSELYVQNNQIVIGEQRIVVRLAA